MLPERLHYRVTSRTCRKWIALANCSARALAAAIGQGDPGRGELCQDT